MDDNPKLLKILLLLTALMLCVAVFPVLPQMFYIVLRLVVCGTSLYVGFKLRYHEKLHGHFIMLIVLGILFNPLMPIGLIQWVWLPVYLGVAVYFLTLSKKIEF